MVKRIYVEKLQEYDSGAKKVLADITDILSITPKAFRKILRYDIENLPDMYFEISKASIFSEPTVDTTFDKLEVNAEERILIVEYLGGQYDQRADSASQCVQLLTGGNRPLIKCATVYIIGGVDSDSFEKIKRFLINPVDSKEGEMTLPETLVLITETPDKMRQEVNFIGMSKEALLKFYSGFGFAMTFEDLSFVQDYFIKENREPTHTELKVIDTYWSDHCRHTTFLTKLSNVKIFSTDPNIEKAFLTYSKAFEKLYKDRSDKYPCLMSIATIAAKELSLMGYLQNLDVSEEINACSVSVMVDNDGVDEEWLIMFKNETHNHPTEIEPFGGAATCLGGAIRDPLSGRAYVYQAMRITGAGNPLEDISKTIKGKLPQRVLTKTALAGFSSYGNQIGLATGIVHELYNDGYKAKRLETGFVIGGAKKENVIRKRPKNGDVVLLLGGDTGRDGCGGATGSSKAHTVNSVELCGAEVQKGNAPEERKLQRLFRNPLASKLILRCNDFGAGGVCVAIGELSEGLDIYLDRVSKKYEGLNATELAISESQERMAVVVESKDVEAFTALAKSENLKVTPVALITDTKRLRMYYKEEVIVDIKREFLDTNGVTTEQNVIIRQEKTNFFEKINPDIKKYVVEGDYEKAILKDLSLLKNCSNKGAGETFDSTIGSATVLMPYGGKKQLTPSTVMASKVPVSGYTETVTCSSYGIYPDLMIASPYLGSVYSIVSAVSKLIASGVKYETVYLTLQEYFKRLNKDEERWGEPLSALLGAYDAQIGLHIGAIGGKDSMSGTFENIDVPPTLIAFGMGIAKADRIVHNAFNTFGHIHILRIPKDKYGRPDFNKLLSLYDKVEKLIQSGKVLNSAVVESDVIVTLCRCILGNGAGIALHKLDSSLFQNAIGDIILAFEDRMEEFEYLGELNNSGNFSCSDISINSYALKKAFCDSLESVFPSKAPSNGNAKAVSYISADAYNGISVAKPRVFIPVFPGTNCEYDTEKAFINAGALVNTVIIKNQTPSDIAQSIEAMAKAIQNSQIIAFPGGFSGGDEPDGSGKFIATAFRNPLLKERVENLLYKQDGLILGICNGFQALIKLSLLPFGKIITQNRNSATLTYNNIARHVSTISKIRIASNASPWLKSFSVGEIFNVPISHGEGKLICPTDTLELLEKNGQIATQYVDESGNVTMVSPFNPNGSVWGIEGLLSPDGRVFGKMGHTERWQKGLYQNVEGNFAMNIFKNGVDYYK